MPDGHSLDEVPNLDPDGDDLFVPVDPGAISPGPEASSPQAPPDEEPHPPGVDDEAAPLPEFPPEFRQEFQGLLYLGQLTHEFHWMGHSFVIHTLKVDALLEMGLITKRYAGSIAEAKAMQAATVAACVDSVDGRPLPVPITNQPEDTVLINRFNYVVRHWYPPTIDAVYDEYLALEQMIPKILEALGNLFG